MKHAIGYILSSKVAGGPSDDFDESFDNDLAKVSAEEAQRFDEDRRLSQKIFDRFEEREFNSISDFFAAVPTPDLSYLRWTRVAQGGFEKEHHDRELRSPRHDQQD